METGHLLPTFSLALADPLVQPLRLVQAGTHILRQRASIETHMVEMALLTEVAHLLHAVQVMDSGVTASTLLDQLISVLSVSSSA